MGLFWWARALMALRLRDGLLWLGLLSFWESDALIAYTKFIQPLLYGEKGIIGLYAFEHGLIGARTARIFLRKAGRELPGQER